MPKPSRTSLVLLGAALLAGCFGADFWALERLELAADQPGSYRSAFLLGALNLTLLPLGLALLLGRPRTAAKTLLFGASLLCCVFVLEVVSARTDLLVPAEFKDRHLTLFELFEPDPELGFRARPNLRDFLVTWSVGGARIRYDTDEYGLRNTGRSYEQAKLFFIGDSFTWGVWVEREETFPDLIERELNVPIINLGRESYYLEQYELMARKFLEKYHPDVVALCIFANDLTEPVTPEDLKNFYRRYNWNQYESYPAPKKLLSYRTVELLRERIKAWTEVVDYDNEWRPGAHLDWRVGPSGLRFYRRLGAIENYFTSSFHLHTKEVLRRTLEHIRSRGVTPIVFLLPSKESAYKDEFLQLFPSAYLNTEEEGYRRLCAVAASMDVQCVNLTPLFRERSKHEQTYLKLDPHCNANGHRVTADGMLPYLRALLPS